MRRYNVSDGELKKFTMNELQLRPKTLQKPGEELASSRADNSDELDLHQKTVEEAIPLVDSFLEQKYCAGRRRVWVVHGKGSGTLRREVGRFLGKHSLVRRSAQADSDRGGQGATQVDLVD